MTLEKACAAASTLLWISLATAGCIAPTGTEAEGTTDEALAGNPADIDIGFNGPPDQFAYTDDFYAASTVHPGPRLCHTYVAWNVAEQPAGMGDSGSKPGERPWLEYWLHEAEGHCDEALISFQSHTRGNPPRVSDFAAAFEAFLAVPWRAETGFTGKLAFTPWNEPDNQGGAGNGLGQVIEPERAAAYYLSMVKPCERHGCKVAAGDFASNGNWWNDFEWNCANDNVPSSELCKQASPENPGHEPASYLDRYKDYIANHAREFGLPDGFRPAYFAFHGWHDANEYLHAGNHCGSYGDCVTRRLLKSLGGSWGGVQIWDTEVGVDQDGPPISDAEQACGAAFLVRITAVSPRIKRLYYTRMHGGTGELMRSHLERPAFEVLAERRTQFAGGHCR